MPAWPASIDLTDIVIPGDTVAWNHASSEPLSLVERLIEQRHRFGGQVGVLLTGVACSGTLDPRHADTLRFRGIGGLGTLAPLATAGVLDVIPCRYSDLPGLIRTRRVPVDVYLTTVSLPDADGMVSLGPTVAVAPDCLDVARVTVAEVNPHVPFVGGDGLIDLHRFDHVVYSDRPLSVPQSTAGRRSATTSAICDRIAGFVRDGSTIQLGIGSIGRLVPAALTGRRDLGVHAGLMTDEVLELVKSGVVNGSRKTPDRGLAVAGELYCGPRWLSWADHNPAIALRASEYLLDDAVLAGLTDFISVNGAIEVDLTGQVNAEVMGGAPVGAVGGQVDLVRAATRSPGGTSIIALASSGGGRSRIVPALESGVVTTPRHEVDVVITEHGVAALRGLSVEQRVAAMISIAHPDFRAALTKPIPR